MSKKVIAVIMTAVLSISLAGCGLSTKNNEEPENTEITLENEETNLTGKWARDFTLKEFTEITDNLITQVEKKTKEYGLEYTEEEVVKENNVKTVTVENEGAEKNRLQGMYFKRTLFTENLSSGQFQMKLLLNFDGEKALKENKFDFSSTSLAKYSEIITGISNRDFSEFDSKILEILKSDSQEGVFTNNIEGVTEEVTVTGEYIVYSIKSIEYSFK